MGIKTVSHPPYSPDLPLVTFGYFLGCRYETIEKMKEAVTKVIDTLIDKVIDDFHGAYYKLFERYNKCISAGGNNFLTD